MTKTRNLVLVALALGCTIRPKIEATETNRDPVITYRLVSGWVGLKDEIRIYRSGWIENFFSSALSQKKTYRSSNLSDKNLKTLLKNIDKIDLADLKSEYRGAVIYDAPVENLTLKKGERTVTCIVHPGANLPASLTELLKNVAEVKAGLQSVSERDLYDPDEIATAPQSYNGRTIAIEGFFLLTPQPPCRIVKTLDGQTPAIDLITTLPTFVLKALDRHQVIAIGKFSNGALTVENLEELGG